jgi:hypothetical protein
MKGIRHVNDLATGRPMYDMVCRVTQLRINEPIEKDFFRLKFQPGSFYWDRDRGVKVQISSTSFPYRLFIAYLFAVILGLSYLIVWFRRKKHHESNHFFNR